MPPAISRRWRALVPRSRARLIFLASTSLLVGAWLVYFLGDRAWRSRVEVRSPGVTVPLAFSPDSRTFATADVGRITLWDVSTGRERGGWEVPKDRFAQAGAFSPDGRTFAAALSGYPRPMVVALIDVASGRTTATLDARLTNVFKLGFATDGRSVFLLSADTGGLQEILYWDAATGQPLSSRRSPPVKHPEHYLAASADGRRLASAWYLLNGTVWLRDLADGDLGKSVPFGATSARTVSTVSAAALSGDGGRLAIGRAGGSVEVWDVATRRLIRTLEVHRGGHVSVALEFAPDGRTIASRGEPGRVSGLSQALRDLGKNVFGYRDRPSTEVVVMDLATGERLARSGTSIHPTYSPDGRTIATNEFDGSVRLRDVPGSSVGDD